MLNRRPPLSPPTASPDVSPRENETATKSKQGFVNFFGEQRFGRDGTNNLDVGLLLLGCEWARAVDRIMAPHPADTPFVAEAKEAFFRGDDYAYTMG